MKRTFVLLLLLAAAAACVPPRAPGDLSPVGARVTNSAVSADLVTLDGWRRRVAALADDASAPRTTERAYAVAKAGAWVAYAREVYLADPRDVMADSALEHARRITEALRANGPVPSADDAAGTTAVRADLRAALDSLRGRVTGSERVTGLADAELALVRADRLAREDAGASNDATALRAAAERSCRMQMEIIRAARLVDWLRETPTVIAAAPRPAPPPTPTPVVVEAAAPTPAATPAPTPAPARAPARAPAPAKTQAIVAALDAPADLAEGGQAVRRTVHFAVGSIVLSPASRQILDGVAAIMRRHPGTGVALAGYTDWRAGTLYNRVLARKRAVTVRDYLEGGAPEMGQVTIVAAGADSAGRAHQKVDDYARDRRVELILLDADGNPLTAAGLSQADHEHDLQVESEAQAKRLARMRWKPTPRASAGSQR